ncbi:hypothetical protein LguiA_001611 [Lonicera macranthoides]
MLLAQYVAAPDDQQAVNIEPLAVPSVQLDELKEITDNFNAEFFICEGIYGSLYRGIMKSGQESFIKRLDSNKLPDQEFLAQVSVASKLKHENVVELLHYCADGGLRVLAYAYTPIGSLHDIIHGAQPAGRFLTWSQRVKIVAGAAKGIQYLHEGYSNDGIVHCNITSRNVLLFDDYVPKVAYFILSTPDHLMEALLDSFPSLLTLDDRAPE